MSYEGGGSALCAVPKFWCFEVLHTSDLQPRRRRPLPNSSFRLPPSALRLLLVLLVDGVVGELAEVRQPGDLVTGELTRSAGTEIHALHVGGNGEVLGRVGRGGADAGGEDAEVQTGKIYIRQSSTEKRLSPTAYIMSVFQTGWKSFLFTGMTNLKWFLYIRAREFFR